MKEQTARVTGQPTSGSDGAATTHFKPEELRCRCGCGLNNISPALVETLERIRHSAGIELKITSGCRCVSHNKAVGGKSDSAHLKGLAVDIAIDNSHERYLVTKAAITAGIERLGIGTSLIHLDIDKDKQQEVVWLYA